MVDYEYTSGGIRGKLDTATFELLDDACLALYKNFPSEEGYCIFTSTEDKQGDTIVQHTFKVRRHIDNGCAVGYTLNMYLTNNTLLLNGKDLDRFMDVHLPVLHEIMCISVAKFRSIPTLNNLLADRMQQLLEQRVNARNLDVNTSVHENQKSVSQFNDSIGDIGSADDNDINQCSPVRSPAVASHVGDTDPTNIICTKCKRACKTRAAVCQIGNHWIHYHCDRLSSDEIDRLHKDTGYIYNCKDCLQHNTCVKAVANRDTSRSPVQRPNLTKPQNASKQSMKRCTSASQLKLPKLSHERASNRESAANDLLLEEVDQLCNVCGRTITEDDIACIKCNLISHLNCMDPNNSDECLACAAVESQQNQNKDCENKLANSQGTNAQMS